MNQNTEQQQSQVSLGFNAIADAFDALSNAMCIVSSTLMELGTALINGHTFLIAMQWAKLHEPKLYHLYIHSRKRRVKKKYLNRAVKLYQKVKQHEEQAV